MNLQTQVKANLCTIQREIKQLEAEKRSLTPSRPPSRGALVDRTNTLENTQTRDLKREVKAKDAIITGLHSRIDGLKAKLQVYAGDKKSTNRSFSLGRPPVLLKERRKRLMAGSFEHYFQTNLAKVRES